MQQTNSDIQAKDEQIGGENIIMQQTDKDVCAWYVMKVLWRQETKTAQRFAEAGLETYLPMKQVLREYQKRKERKMVPVINGLLFVHSSIHTLEEVKKLLSNKYGQTIYFYTNIVHGKNKITSIPEKQMDDFKMACSLAGDSVKYFLPEEVQLKKGARVRIHGGAFDGCEGVLLKVKGIRQKSFVISIEGFLSAAIADISPEFIEQI